MRAPSRPWKWPCCADRARAQGTGGLAHALATFRSELARLRKGERCDIHPSEPRARLADADLAAAAELLARLGHALQPLENIARGGMHGFAGMAALHRATIERLGSDDDGNIDLFAGQDGVTLSKAFDDIAEQADADLPITPGDYLEMFDAAISDRVVRRPGVPGARVRIYGPLEARLVTVDRVVLGGLCRRHMAAGSARPIRGSAGRCGISSASICRSGASASPPTTSRSCSAPREAILTRVGQGRRRAGGRLALPAAPRRRRRASALGRRRIARHALSRPRPQPRPAGAHRPHQAAGADARRARRGRPRCR